MQLTIGFFSLVIWMAQAASVPAGQNPPGNPSPVASATVESETQAKLARVRRIYVDSFGEDKDSREFQAMVINALAGSKRFIVTENKDKADAILKGSGLEKTSQEYHALGEGAAASTAAGGHQGTVSGSVSGGTGTISGSSSGGFAARSVAAEDSVASTETVNDARLAVRLVSIDGDIVWSTTQESRGAKYKGASADVAEKIVRQLLRDLDRAAKPDEKSSGSSKQ